MSSVSCACRPDFLSLLDSMECFRVVVKRGYVERWLDYASNGVDFCNRIAMKWI